MFYTWNMGAADQIDDSSSNSNNDGEVDGDLHRVNEVLESLKAVFQLNRTN